MFVFAGIFALLAWRPLSLPGVFELAIAHKLAMTVVAVSAGCAADRGARAERGVQPGGYAVRLYGQRTGKGTVMSPPQRNSTARLGVGVTAALVLLVAVIELAKATV